MRNKGRNRSRAYYRHHRKRVIRRKKRIANQLGWQPRFEGLFAKGKIHCSCYYCSEKTRTLGFPKSQQVKLERSSDFQDIE